MTDSCIFCSIAAGSVPADLVYADDSITAFHDLDPKAPTHILVVPNRHIESLAALDDAQLAAALLATCARVAEAAGVASSGYRVVSNVGTHGGQSVPHLHFHVLGGRPMRWPPG